MTMALVRVNEHGRRIGETHRNARHSDADVERAIAAYEVLQSYAKVAAAVWNPRAGYCIDSGPFDPRCAYCRWRGVGRVPPKERVNERARAD